MISQKQQRQPGTHRRNTPDEGVETMQASIYPMLGIGYFSTHPRLWLSTICHLIFAMTCSLVITVLLFVFVLRLQARGLISVNCPEWAAWLVSVIFTLIESVVASLVFALIYFPIIMDSLFDKVLQSRNIDLAKNAEKAKRNCGRNASRCFHPIVFGLVTLVALPVALIPFLGWYLFFVLSAYFTAWGAHLHYFDLKGLTYKEAKAYRVANWSKYLSFGLPAAGLQMIPIAGMFFMLTNSVGAALWAADLEEAGRGPLTEFDAAQQATIVAAQDVESSPLLTSPGSQKWSLNGGRTGSSGGSVQRV